MMEGHEMMKKTTTTPAPRRDSYDYYSESNYLGSASSRHETVLNFNRPSNKGFTTNPTKQTPNSVAPTKFAYGPMVVRVHPDGRPVQEDKVLPIDDDVHHYIMMKTKIPNLREFESRSKPSFNGPYAFYIRPSTRQ